MIWMKLAQANAESKSQIESNNNQFDSFSFIGFGNNASLTSAQKQTKSNDDARLIELSIVVR